MEQARYGLVVQAPAALARVVAACAGAAAAASVQAALPREQREGVPLQQLHAFGGQRRPPLAWPSRRRASTAPGGGGASAPSATPAQCPGAASAAGAGPASGAALRSSSSSEAGRPRPPRPALAGRAFFHVRVPCV
ncbi:unnamed protein product [Prorocentrum cordatum]|uniref:Uncharacterized protein n=1 Tax=Prorocentrum cordatum TaxID=2364126 RepID=A0ABN9T174_9DINO|nr:unnamed protein product [Polarella glacialis]